MDRQAQFIEDMGLYFERTGLTRMAGRIIAWLLISDPAQQTMAQIGAALGASKSSISTSLRMLVQFQLVDQISLPGERSDYYRLSPGLVHQSLKARMGMLTELRRLAEQGLEAIGEAAPEQRRRLELVRDMNAFLEREFPKLLDLWEQEQSASGGDPR
jgi:DNA-binding transcriptional regulator GbsR (MarR family)